jgi:hypothetical protein
MFTVIGANRTAIPGGPLIWIQTVENCAEQLRRRSPAHGYPPSLAAMDAPDFRCLDGHGLLDEEHAGLRRGELEGFRYIYTPGMPDANGAITTFRLDVRPVKFGHGVTTSYLCDPRGELRVTNEDRPAEHTDKNAERDERLEDDHPYYCVGQRKAPNPGQKRQ